MAGFIVLMPNCLDHEYYHKNPLGIGAKKDLDRLHFKKIELCDYVLVVNECGYIGESTAREIAYAKKLGKPISYVFDNKELVE
jgi:nucleoside 2-deoxyribosyltransferase